MIIDRYHPVWGGAENQLAALSERLQDQDINVSIVTRRWTPDLEKEEVQNGITIYRKGVPGTASFCRTICYGFGLMMHILQHRNQIDIVHTHGAALLGAAGKFYSTLIGKPNVVKIATAGKIVPLQSSIWGKRVLFLLKRSTKVVALSAEIESELQAAGVPSFKIVSIPNGVDTDRFLPASPEIREKIRAELGLNAKEKAVLFSGRIVPRKGLDLLINSWTEVSAHHPEARLWILGSGKNQADSIEKELKERVRNENLEHVHWLGETTEPENFYQAADIFVFPSRREGLSNTLLEAMACGLPSIASDIGGNIDVIEDGENGRLFPSDDSAELSTVLLGLLKTPEERQNLSVSARADVLKRFDLEETTRRYAELYKELQSTKPDRDQHRKYSLRSWMSTIQHVCLILLVILFVGYLVKERDQVIASLGQMNLQVLPFILWMLVFMNLFKAATWASFSRAMPGIHIPFRTLSGAWMTSLIGKYLPGSVWDMFSRLILMVQNGASRSRAVLCISMEQIYSMMASLFLVLITPELQVLVGPAWPLLLLAAVLVIIVISPVGQHLLFGLLRTLKPDIGTVLMPPFSERIRYFLESCVSRLLSGILLGAMLMLFQIEVQIYDIMYLSAILSLSYIAGYISLITPGGVGVREGALVFFLSDWMPIATAVTLAFSLRILGFFADMFTVLIGKRITPQFSREV